MKAGIFNHHGEGDERLKRDENLKRGEKVKRDENVKKEKREGSKAEAKVWDVLLRGLYLPRAVGK